jgi:hypothetical protein
MTAGFYCIRSGVRCPTSHDCPVHGYDADCIVRGWLQVVDTRPPWWARVKVWLAGGRDA